MKILSNAVVALIFGLIGGLIAITAESRLNRRQETTIQATTVKADQFELEDPATGMQAYWGYDAHSRDIVIAFLGKKGQTLAEFGVEPVSDERGSNELNPFTSLNGGDGETRFSIHMDKTKQPQLAMGGGGTEKRLILGHILRGDAPASPTQDPYENWALILRDPSHGWQDYLDLGVTTPLHSAVRTGYAVISNSAGQHVSTEPK